MVAVGTPELERARVIETNETQEQAQSSQGNFPSFTTSWQVPLSLPEVCIACYDGTEEQGTLIRTCPIQNGSHLYHVECIKSLFLAACKDESLMPPSCCGPIKLSIGLSVLSTLEQELFMAKYEEWSATDRVYCPVLSCSAFIPKRLIPDLKFQTTAHERSDQWQLHVSAPGFRSNSDSKDAHHPSELLRAESSFAELNIGTVLGAQPTLKDSAIPIDRSSFDTAALQFSCPKCKVLLCTLCKQLYHSNEQCGADNTGIDPTLLRRLGIKRCPKCAQGIRIMFGCSHIRCRCGANFCSRCLQSMDKCKSDGCRPILDDAGTKSDEEAVADAVERDLDEADDRTVWANSDMDFGEEPPSVYFDPWGCYHVWADMQESTFDHEIDTTCHFCWKTIEIQNAESGSSMLTCQLCRAAACKNCTENMATNNTSGELRD